MQQKNNYSRSDALPIKQKLTSLLNKTVIVLANDGSDKNPRITKFEGKLTIVTNNIFCIEQNINNCYKTTKTFLINGLVINKLSIKECE